MTGLLVSVRDAAEAQAALRGGADLIDVKEPLRGSLGPAAPQVWREIREVIPTSQPLSAALGELAELSPNQTDLWCEHLDGYQFAKIGLAGCVRMPAWQSRWGEILSSLSPQTARVAVIYADWKSASAPPPDDVMQAAQDLQCGAILIDTYHKALGSVTDCLPHEELARLFRRARAAHLKTVLAGSLTLSLARDLLQFAPDLFAVRGAVCHGGRTGTVDAALVAEFAKMLLSSREEAKQMPSPAAAISAA
jgi:uncharacterized protein (UPF0264 family)